MKPPSMQFWAILRDSARLMVGVPRYDVYLAHMAEKHPDEAVMSYPDFFRNRQDARYGGGASKGISRCC